MIKDVKENFNTEVKMSIIEVSNLKKVFRTSIRRDGRFGTLRSLVSPLIKEQIAVSDVSFRIEKGESVGYLGPNGAGKSTTIKMLTGILVPSGGNVEIGRIVPYNNRIRNSYQIGAVFGQRSQLVFDLPAKDSFELEKYNKNIKEFVEYLDLEDLLNKPVRTLSLGQRMRCEILAALLHEPEILLLDEPTIGLDVVAKERIRAFIEEINREKGVTVLLTTHDLNDIERLCQRVIIIDKGKLIYDGSLKYIKERFATERQIRAVMPDHSAALLAAGQFQNDSRLKVTVEELVLQLTYDQRSADTAELLRMILAKANPSDLTVKEESVESIIRRIYQEGIGNMAEQAAPAGLEAGI